MFRFLTELFPQYWRSRIPSTRYIPLAIFLAAAGLASHPTASLVDWAFGFLLSYGLIAQFRLLDDLEDRDLDCFYNPNRILCRAQTLTPFYAIFVLLVIISTSLLSYWPTTRESLVTFLVLLGAYLFWYRFRSSRLPGTFRNAIVVLAKYPIMVGLIALGVKSKLVSLDIAISAAVYATFLLYEELHDSRYRRKLMIQWMATLYGVVITGLILFVSTTQDAWLSRHQILGGLVLLITGLMVVWLLARNLTHRQLTLASYLPFAISFLAVFTALSTSK